MSKERRAYHFIYNLLWIIAVLLYPTRCIGREKVPEGGCLICANHSHALDPLFLAVGITKKHYLHFMCKKELMSVPIVGWWIRRVGSFAVDRSGGDINAIRTAMRLLKNGEKVMIFPEGTRSDTDDAVAAKTGAIRLAARLHVPIVPVYIPREKKLFHKVVVRVGEPYYVDCANGDHEAFAAEAEALMDRISALHREGNA